MGCDIHLHVEIKVSGKWEHYSCPDVNRNYVLFAKMAGVRNQAGIVPIAQPRGLPKDMSVVTDIDAEGWLLDRHSESWLNSAEVAELETWAIDTITDEHTRWRFRDDYWGYLFGGSFSGFVNHREDYPDAVEDVRFVFWFDN